MNQATKKTDYLFEDGFDADFNGAVEQTSAEDIRKNAHIVNGGEAEFKCPACRGTGNFVGYTGRVLGACFKCKGKGNISKGQNAAIKGKATKQANQEAWQAEHQAEIAYMRKRADKGSTFYAGMLEKLRAYGTLFDSNIEAARRDMAKDAEFFAKKDAEREAARPKVDISAIQAMFDKAAPKLTKSPIFRTVDVTIKQAKATSANPGALYVYDTGTADYLGKLQNGKWVAKYGTKDVTQALMNVAADPTAEAIKYARDFNACCCCGKTLRNPVSVLAVVGPICGPRWGLDHLRMEAEMMLAEEKAKEEAGK